MTPTPQREPSGSAEAIYLPADPAPAPPERSLLDEVIHLTFSPALHEIVNHSQERNDLEEADRAEALHDEFYDDSEQLFEDIEETEQATLPMLYRCSSCGRETVYAYGVCYPVAISSE